MNHKSLKSKIIIESLFKQGESFVAYPFLVRWKEIEPSSISLQVLIGASSKKFKKAVDRNRIKRLTRESFRLNSVEFQKSIEEKNLFLGLSFVCISKELPDFAICNKGIKKALKCLQNDVIQKKP